MTQDTERPWMHGHTQTVVRRRQSPEEGFQWSGLTAAALHEFIWSREVVAELHAEGQRIGMSTDAGTHQRMTAWDLACIGTPLGLHSREVCVNTGVSVDKIQQALTLCRRRSLWKALPAKQRCWVEIPPKRANKCFG